MLAGPSSAPSATPSSTRPYRLANAISYTASPLIFPPLLFGMVLTHFGATGAEVGRGILIAVTCFGLIPLAYLLWLLRHHRIATLEVRTRERRTTPYLIGVAASAAAFVPLAFFGGTAVAWLYAFTLCLTVNTFLLMCINLRWKISVHVAAGAGFVGMLGYVSLTAAGTGFLSPPLVVGMALMVPLLMWARVTVGAHTRAQALGGAFFGLLLAPLELHLLHTLGLFLGG